jgi:hypothetical protein
MPKLTQPQPQRTVLQTQPMLEQMPQQPLTMQRRSERIVLQTQPMPEPMPGPVQRTVLQTLLGVLARRPVTT